MPATTLNLKDSNRLEAGATFLREWQLVDATSLDPHDLTGHTFTSSFRRNYVDASPAFTATIVLLDAVQGTIQFKIDHADMTAFAVSVDHDQTSMQGVWDLESLDGSGDKTRWLEGTWVMTPESTRE